MFSNVTNLGHRGVGRNHENAPATEQPYMLSRRSYTQGLRPGPQASSVRALQQVWAAGAAAGAASRCTVRGRNYQSWQGANVVTAGSAHQLRL